MTRLGSSVNNLIGKPLSWSGPFQSSIVETVMLQKEPNQLKDHPRPPFHSLHFLEKLIHGLD